MDHNPAEGQAPGQKYFGAPFDKLFDQRLKEADEFYEQRVHLGMSDDPRLVQRQAFAGLLWGKQSYHYDVGRWLRGDSTQPTPDPQRLQGRNHDWIYLHNSDVISMPDKWEYPWYAAWDLAFHCVAMALIDPDFAKEQLILFLREWYMHPNGQLPAYEWNFSDVNPPVHAWAAWRVYKIAARIQKKPDRTFLERVFHKLLLNFTWWVNRKDPQGKNVFEGGFLGLDNIGVFDRSQPLGPGSFIEQSDGTSWMAMFCLDMLSMAIELAHDDPAYEDVASKFFEHFVYISQAMNDMGGEGIGLWDDKDGFYYDVLHRGGSGEHIPMKVRSMVGLIPLFAVETFDPEDLARFPAFKRRMQWFLDHHPDVAEHVDMSQMTSKGPRLLLTIANRQKLERIYRYMLDEKEFLSPYGIRALSKFHRDHPFYVAGGWPVAFGELRAGRIYHRSFRRQFELARAGLVSDEFSAHRIHAARSLITTATNSKWNFQPARGRRKLCGTPQASFRAAYRTFFCGAMAGAPCTATRELMQKDPYWRDLILFYEYFNGETGAGLGASHQTGWTALVAKLLEQSGE